MKKADYTFVTRTAVTGLFDTTYYFESVENALRIFSKDETFLEIDNGGLMKHVKPVNINEMIKLLNSIKEKGGNYAQIQYDSDNLCCKLIGLDIRKSTPDEIDMHINYEKSFYEKEKQIKELEKQIRDIKKSM